MATLQVRRPCGLFSSADIRGRCKPFPTPSATDLQNPMDRNLVETIPSERSRVPYSARSFVFPSKTTYEPAGHTVPQQPPGHRLNLVSRSSRAEQKDPILPQWSPSANESPRSTPHPLHAHRRTPHTTTPQHRRSNPNTSAHDVCRALRSIKSGALQCYGQASTR